METIVGPLGQVLVSPGGRSCRSPATTCRGSSRPPCCIRRRATTPCRSAWGREKRAPHVALWMTTLAIQGFLLVTWFAEQAFTLALKMTSAMTLLPYLLVAAYGLKLAPGPAIIPCRRAACAVEGPPSSALALMPRPCCSPAGRSSCCLLCCQAPGTWAWRWRGASRGSIVRTRARSSPRCWWRPLPARMLASGARESEPGRTPP